MLSAVFNLACTAVCIVTAIVLLVRVGGKEKVLDKQIEMYESENLKIEAVVDSVAKDYLGYEKDAYEEMRSRDEDVMASVIAYPELTSNGLIVKQLEIHTSNNEKIKELKAEKIELSRMKWWLYFGK